MRQTIFFLDEDSGCNRGFKVELEQKGFDLITPTSFADLDAAIDMGAVMAMVFAAPHSTTKTQMVTRVVERWPHFPVVAILPNDSEFEKKFPKDEMHQVIRPLSRKSNLIEGLESVLRVGAIHREIHVLREQKKSTPEPLVGFFDSLDLSVVVDTVLLHFSKMTSSRGVMWMLPSAVQGLVAGAPHQPSVGFVRSLEIRSLQEENDEVLWARLLKLFRANRTRLDLHQACSLFGQKEQSLLMPILHPVTESPMAYLLFEGIESTEGELRGLVPQSLSLMSRHIQFSLEHHAALSRSFVDDLTELYNQRYLPLVLDNEIVRSRRLNRSFSVLFLDVDLFKSVNDTRGHWIGSKVLVELGQIIKKSVRSSDYAFRYGGDEFLIVLTETDVAQAQIVAERLRKKVEQTTFRIDGVDLAVTVSIGLAAFPDHAQTSSQVIQMADQAMYYGKHKSRNVVYVAS